FADLRACSRLAARGARTSHSEAATNRKLRGDRRSRHDLAAKFLALLHRTEARGRVAQATAGGLRTPRAIPNPEWLWTFPVYDKRAARDPSGRQRGRNRLGFLRIQMETARRDSRSALVRAASAAIGLANVVRGPRRSPRARRGRHWRYVLLS